VQREIGGRVTDHAERRRHKRYDRPALLITLEGHTYQASNWSLGGVLLNGYDGSRDAGEVLRGQLGFAGGSMKCSFEGLVVRVNPENQEIAFGFAGLSDEALSLLNSHAAALDESN
jgi:hypothetical protein